MRGEFHREGEAPPAPPPLSPALPDAHCHLDLMSAGVDDAVRAAAAVGIAPLVTIGIDAESSAWAATAAAEHPGVYAAVAIHPNEAPAAPPGAWERIEALAGQPRVVAVGETGLDRYRTGEDGWQAQEESFRRHIDLAKRTGKALVIHDRDAHEAVLAALAAEGAPERVVFHCFSGDAAFARACLDSGYVLSFAGNVTFRSAGALREAAALTPPAQLLVETDAPFLTPEPYRGRPNAPYLVPLTLRALAAVKGLAEEELAAGVAATAARTFGWAA